MNEDTKALAPIRVNERGLVLTSIDDMWRFAGMVCRSGLAPSHFKTPEAVCVALQAGAEIGLSPFASLQNLTVIRGRVGMYGEVARALCEADPVCDYIRDNLEKIANVTEWKDEDGCTVKAKRKDRPEVIRTFTVGMAKRAGLWGKDTWGQYPGRMLYWRALGWALRDAFGDILRGLKTAEELADYPNAPPVGLSSGDEVPADDLDALTVELEQQSEEVDDLNAAGGPFADLPPEQ